MPTSSRNIPAGRDTGSEKGGSAQTVQLFPTGSAGKTIVRGREKLFMGYIPFPGREVAALRGVQQIICLQIGRFLDPKRILVSQSYSASKMSLPPPFFFFSLREKP